MYFSAHERGIENNKVQKAHLTAAVMKFARLCFLVELILSGALSYVYAQGLVNFMNTPETLISVRDPLGGSVAINGPVGSYYFGLLTASPGATQPSLFAFRGVYATNVNTPGRINGGLGVPVPGWEPGTVRSFIVCGWSASAGATFDPAWLSGLLPFAPKIKFGMSPISVGISGGFDAQTGENRPALDIFGSTTISSGFLLEEYLCLSCDPPAIRVQPSNQIAIAGMTVRFTVGAQLTPQLAFQWFCNGTALAEGKDSVLELTHVALSQNANRYYVVVTNPWGAVMSDTVTLAVAPGSLADVRSVPGLAISSQQGISLEVLSSDAIVSSVSWSNLQGLVLTTNRNWWFDLSGSSTQRFYRTLQSSAPGPGPILALHRVPAITLTGAIGSQVQIEYVNQSGPTNAWVYLATLVLTNSPQLYFDTSAIGQPPRFYSLIPQ
jgi:hypothetical protein